MNVRSYQPSDYQKLIDLYKQSDQFKVDEVTDSEEGLNKKIARDPESVLLVEANGEIVGSVSLIEDGRIALLFRLVTKASYQENKEVLQVLLNEAESILSKRGYKEVHNTAPANDMNALMERKSLGFQEGEIYTWFWKELK